MRPVLLASLAVLGACTTLLGIEDIDLGAQCGDGETTGPETCDDGNTADGDTCSADCLAVTCPIVAGESTIQSAVDNPDCARILVAPGTYVENIIVGRPVAIVRFGGGDVFVDGAGAGSVFETTADADLTLRDIVIRNGSAARGGGLHSNSNATLERVSISNCAADEGGGIGHYGGLLTLVDATISNNTAVGADAFGGAVHATADVVIQSSQILNNTADSSMSGAAAGAQSSRGGALSIENASLTVSDTMITDSSVTTAGDNASGGAIDADNSTLALTDVRIERPSCAAQVLCSGGALFAAASVVAMERVDIEEAGVRGQSGAGVAMRFIDSEVTFASGSIVDSRLNGMNQVDRPDTVFGGGIAMRGGSLTMTNSRIVGVVLTTNALPGRLGTPNGVANGGALDVRSDVGGQDTTVVMEDCSVEGNSMRGQRGSGAAMRLVAANGANLDVLVRRTLLAGNSVSARDAQGGAVEVIGTGASTSIRFVNSSIADNRVFGSDADTGSPVSRGGGLRVQGEATTGVTFWHSTIAANEAEIANGQLDSTEGGGVSIAGLARVTLFNSILADNVATAGSDCFSTPQLITDTSSIVEVPVDCTLGTASPPRTGIDPLLGQLLDNGGPTKTMALGTGSPAIDTGLVGSCVDPSGVAIEVDQRGLSRPVGSACDVGAFESR